MTVKFKKSMMNMIWQIWFCLGDTETETAVVKFTQQVVSNLIWSKLVQKRF